MQSDTRKTLKIYLNAVLKYKTSLFFALISIFGAALMGVTIPLFFKEFFDLLASGQSSDVIADVLE